MSARSHPGGCLCGAVRYEVAGPVEHLCFCHCVSCRRSAGATPVAWGTVDASRFRVLEGSLASIQSSPPVVRSFCAACGTLVTYTHTARPSHVDFTLASLDEPAALAPIRHIWVSDRVNWTPLADGLPQFPGWATASPIEEKSARRRRGRATEAAPKPGNGRPEAKMKARARPPRSG
jgi:hypothetical protein